MKRIEIKNAKDLEEYKSSNEISNLNFKGWSDGNIDLREAKTGYINLIDATTGDIDLREAKTGFIDLTKANTGDINLRYAKTGFIHLRDATTGNIDLRDAKTGSVYLQYATTGEVKQNYTSDDIEFLKRLPLDVIDLSTWQSNDNWLGCKTIDELHSCGTTYCVRGYAESKYFIENGKICEDVETLYPNLKHLFHMTNEQFKEELKKILK